MRKFLLITALMIFGFYFVDAEKIVTLPLPEIPGNITLPNDRADYLISHFWDNMDSLQYLDISENKILEQSLVDFLDIAPYASSDDILRQGFDNMLEKANLQPKLFKELTLLADLYLFEPDSPMRSEHNYIIYLEALSGFHGLGEVSAARIADRLEMVRKNRIGSIAPDFTFETTDGSSSSLSENLPPKGGELLLIFFDPECETCEKIIEKMLQSTELTDEIKEDRLRILTIYSGDRKEVWLRKVEEFPSAWTSGFNDGKIEEDELYFLPQMPTLYLIDSDGRVVDKNIEWSYVLKKRGI